MEGKKSISYRTRISRINLRHGNLAAEVCASKDSHNLFDPQIFQMILRARVNAIGMELLDPDILVSSPSSSEGTTLR